mgnify:CR=1 FL=1|jgi:ribulose-5-phosphate 4-epimerase/fuculose-1-phosphate aldolase
MNRDELSVEICRVGRSLFERGYAHATAGNISARVDGAHGGGYLITPTDACLGFLQPQTLAWVGPDGQLRSGARPSKRLALHRRIYEADATAGASSIRIRHTLWRSRCKVPGAKKMCCRRSRPTTS